MNSKAIHLFFLFVALFGNSQTDEIKLHKGKWEFCVADTVISPYNCSESSTFFKFKRSGKFVLSGLDLVVHDKPFTKMKGRWELKGNKLKIIPNDSYPVKFDSYILDVVVIESDLFYSPQPDYQMFFWLFKRVKINFYIKK